MKKQFCSGTDFQKRSWGRCRWDLLHKPFTESRSSSINLFTLASYLCTGLFSQSWYWKVSAYLSLFISLFWGFPVIFWHDKCELLWGLRLQLSALCSSPKMVKPALAAVLGMDTVSVLPSSAANALLPGSLPHWKGKEELTGVCRLKKLHRFPVAKHAVKKEGWICGYISRQSALRCKETFKKI